MVADEVVLLAQRCSDIQSKLNVLVETQNTKNTSYFTVTSLVVAKVENFQYLGSHYSGIKIKMGARSKKSWAASASLLNM